MDSSSARSVVERHARLHQHGALNRAQALDAGMTLNQIDRRLRRRQWLGAGPRGWYQLADHAEDPLSRLYASSVGLEAPAWGHSAVALFGLDEHPNEPMVAVRRRFSGTGVRVVWVEGLAYLPRTSVEGIPTVSVEVAIASQIRWRSTLGMHRLIDTAIRAEATTWERLERTLAVFPRRGRAGSGRLKLVMAERRNDPAVPLSEWGRNAARDLADAGLGETRMEWRIVDTAGQFVAQVDLAFPRHRYAIELDSVSHHLNEKAFERDRERDADLARLGWRVRRFTWKQWKKRRPWVLATIRHDLASGWHSNHIQPA